MTPDNHTTGTHSFIHSRVAHKHARNGHALCDTKLNTLVAQSRHFSKRSAYACPLSSALLRHVVRSPVTFAVRTVLAYTSLCVYVSCSVRVGYVFYVFQGRLFFLRYV